MDKSTSFSPLIRVNSFNFASSSFITWSSIISETLPQVIDAQSEDIAVEALIEAITTEVPISLHSVASSLASSNVEAHKVGYKHPNITLDFLTIPAESFISVHKKTFIKTKDLVYFNKLKKYSKIWKYST